MPAIDPTRATEHLLKLKLEHHDLNIAIDRLADQPGCDQLQLTRMKKRRLQLKDAIAHIESSLIPNLDA